MANSRPRGRVQLGGDTHDERNLRVESRILDDTGFAEVADADLESEGFLRVDVAGHRSSRGNYELAVATNHQYDLVERCPGEPDFVYSDRRKARVFEVDLSSENDYTANATANGDPQ
jgi:hypothetical protein